MSGYKLYYGTEIDNYMETAKILEQETKKFPDWVSTNLRVRLQSPYPIWIKFLRAIFGEKNELVSNSWNHAIF